ncbi:MAG: hypothetical protein E7Z62_05505 [Thermoplasmata archaeon]|nr:hypothetical protein [Thermoplasmata archaeon]
MFRNIRLKNFLSFKDIDVSFGHPNGHPLNYALFYGENGAGKTNLIQSVSFLRESIFTLKANDILHNNPDERIRPIDIPDLSGLCKMARTKGSEDNMLTCYTMMISGSKAVYEMEFSKDRLVREKLSLKLDKKSGTLFEMTQGENGIRRYMWDGFVTDENLKKDINSNMDRYWGMNSLLAIINLIRTHNNRDFMRKNLHKVEEVIDYIESIRIHVQPIYGQLTVNRYSFLTSTEYGVMREDEEKALNAYEKALKRFFRRIYHNVDDVFYDKRPVDKGIRYELMFRRKLDGEQIDIPSIRESNGTRKLVNLFQTLVASASGQVAFIDEMDSGIHDKMVYDLLLQLLPEINGQLVITTHNTGLLKKVSPKNVYIIDVDSLGYKHIENFSDKIKTSSNNNNQIRYLNNAVGGVPYIGEVDFRSIAEELIDELEDA